MQTSLPFRLTSSAIINLANVTLSDRRRLRRTPKPMTAIVPQSLKTATTTPEPENGKRGGGSLEQK